jgi:hypothetical protein
LIRQPAGIVLTEALDINENGAILASGYYTSDPLVRCPINEERWDSSGVSTYVFNPDRRCRQLHLFRLRDER